MKDKVEQGRYGPNFPRTPACYGFSIIAKIIPVGSQPSTSMLRNSRRRWESSRTASLYSSCITSAEFFKIKGETYFQYMGIFDTDFDKYTEDAVSLFSEYGLSTVFENLEGFPKIGRGTPQRSLGLYAIIIAPAFWNTASIPSRAPTR